MALVDYSDSEASESEESKPAKPSLQQNTKPSARKPTFQKVVDHFEPHKIRISLPAGEQSAETDLLNEPNEEDRPAKRAKTSGASGGFNALLPAPKNDSLNKGPAKSAQPTGLSSQKNVGLGKGVNLKTGATPAFSRDGSDSMNASPPTQPPDSVGNASNTNNNMATGIIPDEGNAEVKLVGKTAMFKPLSVSRKSARKKKGLSLAPSAGTADYTPPQEKPNGAALSKEKTNEHPQSLSLFSSGIEAPVDPSAYETYELTFEQDRSGAQPREAEETENSAGKQDHATSSQPQKSTNLGDLANDLGLSASERRRLFGRSGKPSDAQVAQFSLKAEYAHNLEQNATQDTAPAHNPVRSIAPGKHSLQQLMNSAATQKDALEEHFANSRRNKKDAGSRYGW